MIDRITTPIIPKHKAEQAANKEQSFKGFPIPILSGLRALNNSPAIGACAVDLCSMVIPRTAIETKNRGKQSGIETFFREGTSCFIHACVGLIGLGAATLVSGKFNKNFGVKAQNIFASGDTIKNMSTIWQNSNGQKKQFFEGFVKSIKGLNGTEWRGVSDSVKDEVVEGLISLSDKMKEASGASGKAKSALKKEIKELKGTILSKITQDTGAAASFRLKAAGEGVKEVSSSLSEFVDNAVSLSGAFKGKTESVLSSFVQKLTNNKIASTVLGLGICAALCMSVQPINRWLTKKRTGQDGFVGVENKKSDKSKGFKKAKTALGIIFPIMAIRTIGKPANLISNVQFNSKIPTINQFKLLYGLTIGSRFMSARDSNELREAVIKDSLGFTNWLILGGMVSKLTARALGGKELINNPVAQDGAKKGVKYAFNWLTKASVKSFVEVLLPNAKEVLKDGKLMKFSEVFKNAAPDVKKKIFKLAGAQIAGYLYSGLVLGIGIAKLNIFITKQVQARRDAKENMDKKIKESPLANLDMNFLKKLSNNSSSVFKDFN